VNVILQTFRTVYRVKYKRTLASNIPGRFHDRMHEHFWLFLLEDSLKTLRNNENDETSGRNEVTL